MMLSGETKSSEEEDEYVKINYPDRKTFHNYESTTSFSDETLVTENVTHQEHFLTPNSGSSIRFEADFDDVISDSSATNTTQDSGFFGIDRGAETSSFFSDSAIFDFNTAVIGTKEAVAALMAYFALGVISYSYVFERWPVVDSLYFSVVTFTTVGYGDLYPSTHAGRIFGSFFALFGFGIIGLSLGVIGGELVHSQHEAFEKARLLSQDILISSVRQAHSEHFRKSIGHFFFDIHKEQDDPENHHQDGDDEIESFDDLTGTSLDTGALRQNISLDWLPNYATFVCSLALLLMGAFYIGKNEGWEWSAAIYYMITTAGTIGYGDLTPTKETTRWFAILYILLAVGIMTQFLSFIADLVISQKRESTLLSFQERILHWRDVGVMDLTGDGKVTELEYITYMLVHLNVVDQDIIDELHQKFNELDETNNGYITKEDVYLRLKRSMQIASSPMSNSSIRSGVSFISKI